MRNVSVTEPQFYGCDTATWPDIPAACVSATPAAVEADGTAANRVAALQFGGPQN